MGLSLGHLFLILCIVLVIWGPSRIGNIGRGIGEAVRGFKRGLHGDDAIDVTDSVRHEIAEPADDRFSNHANDRASQHTSANRSRS